MDESAVERAALTFIGFEQQYNHVAITCRALFMQADAANKVPQKALTSPADEPHP